MKTRTLWGKTVVEVRAGDLLPGDTILNPNSGKSRRVLSSPLACQQRGYVRAETNGEPVNCHKDNIFLKEIGQ